MRASNIEYREIKEPCAEIPLPPQSTSIGSSSISIGSLLLSIFTAPVHPPTRLKK
jgi:hypothetical protein